LLKIAVVTRKGGFNGSAVRTENPGRRRRRRLASSQL
jgi:hypothetical protein